MRRDLMLAFLGIWTAIIPFLPISGGSTQRATLFVTGIAIAVLAFWSFAKSQER